MTNVHSFQILVQISYIDLPYVFVKVQKGIGQLRRFFVGFQGGSREKFLRIAFPKVSSFVNPFDEILGKNGRVKTLRNEFILAFTTKDSHFFWKVTSETFFTFKIFISWVCRAVLTTSLVQQEFKFLMHNGVQFR